MAVVSKIHPGRVPAECLSGDAVGALVYVRGDVINGRCKVASADPSTNLKMPVAAIIVQKQSVTECTIQYHGLTSVYTGLLSGSPYVLGTNSLPAKAGDTNYPTSSGFLIQQIGVAVSANKFCITLSDPCLYDLAHNVAETCKGVVTRSDGKIIGLDIRDQSDTPLIRRYEYLRSGGKISQVIIHRYDHTEVEVQTIVVTVNRDGDGKFSGFSMIES